MVLKGKVVYDFQSVEFEEEVKTGVEYATFFQRFKEILMSLKEVADKVPQPNKTPQKTANNNAKKEPKASPMQIRWLKNLGVDEEEARKMTTSEASDLIKELKEIGSNG
jgi:hypothetical protein